VAPYLQLGSEYQENARVNYEVSLLRLIEKGYAVMNGTVIEISLTGTCSFCLVFSVAEEDRYRNLRQAWDHRRRAGHARMPYVSVRRISLGANYHAGSIFEAAAFSD
jgi:hypothetical protein